MDTSKGSAKLLRFMFFWPLGASLLLVFMPFTSPPIKQDLFGNMIALELYDLLTLTPVFFLFAAVLVTTISISAYLKLAKCIWPLFLSLGLFALRMFFSQTAFFLLAETMDFHMVVQLSTAVNAVLTLLQLLCIALAAVRMILYYRRNREQEVCGTSP